MHLSRRELNNAHANTYLLASEGHGAAQG